MYTQLCRFVWISAVRVCDQSHVLVHSVISKNKWIYDLQAVLNKICKLLHNQLSATCIMLESVFHFTLCLKSNRSIALN